MIVCAHGQPQFLAGAVLSALAQDVRDAGVGVVIVNDGCPFESTETTALELRAAHPDRVRYLRQPNLGVAAARNSGIRDALDAWPEIDALFPLDADNRLSPFTLGTLWAVRRAHPEAGWVYPALECFGREDFTWEVPGEFSVFRQLFENQCDTGSLIAREVFDRGILFDETMRAGYEDWEFFVRAMRAGYRGVPGGRAGFRYRLRGRSMLVTARSRHEHVYADLRARHVSAFEPRLLTRTEHEDLPRFALVCADRDEVLATSSVDMAPRRSTPAALAAAVGAGTAPPVTLIGTAALWELLAGLGLLAGVLLRAQELLRRHPLAALALAPHASPEKIELTETESAGGHGTHAVIASTHDLLSAGPRPPERVFELRIGARLAPVLPPSLGAGPEAELRAAARTGAAPEATGPSHRAFGLLKHVELLETTFPHSGALNGSAPRALWLVADAPEGPAGAGAVNLVAGLRGLGEIAAAHLVITGDAGLLAGRELLDAFETVTLLGGLEPAAGRHLLARILGSADVVLNAGSALGYEALPLMERDHAPVQVALAGEIARDALGLPDDALLIAARDVENLVDVFLATSARAVHQLANLEVVPDKIAELPLGDATASARIAAAAIREAGARAALA